MPISTRLFGDGKPGQAERIQTLRCQACHLTFTARRHTPLSRLKTPSHHSGLVRISREPLDWMLPRPNAFAVTVRPPSLSGCLAAFEHAQSLHERCFRTLQIPHLQLDELRTRLRSATQVLWLWLAIDPLTKIIPVLHLGPRTQNVAHLLIHSLRQILAAFLPPALYERRVKSLLLCGSRLILDTGEKR